MFKKFIIFIFFTLIAASCGLVEAASDPAWAPLVSTTAITGAPMTLKDSFRLASNLNETLKIQQEDIVQSEARARAALGTALPDLHWSLTDTIQDTSGVQKAAGGNSFLTDREHNESQFTLNQIIFSGLREVSAIKGAKYQIKQETLTFQRSTLLLFQDVAISFYTVVGTQARVINTRASLKFAQDRVKDLGNRTRLGKTRESEVLTAEAQVATLKAQETQDLENLSTALNLLSFLTGEDVTHRSFVDDIPLDFPVPTLDEALRKVDTRSDVKAQEDDLMVKRYNVRYQAGYYWPKISATGDYYTKRLGFQENVDWDVILALDVPIYQGGVVRASVKEAASQWRQSQLALDLLRRRVATEIIQTRTQAVAGQDEVRNRQIAYDAAKKSYEIQVREYRLGLVNNLDVIQALDTLQKNRTDLDDSIYQGKLNYLRLKVATEELP